MRELSTKSKIVSFHLALDPAKPWFDLTDASNKVSKEDATLVDVVHTNSGFLLYVRYIYHSLNMYFAF